MCSEPKHAREYPYDQQNMAIIKVRENGPYLVSGDDVTLVDWNGQAYERPKGSFVLCRCGASASKPFCDKTHRRIGFKESESGSPASDPPGDDG